MNLLPNHRHPPPLRDVNPAPFNQPNPAERKKGGKKKEQLRRTRKKRGVNDISVSRARETEREEGRDHEPGKDSPRGILAWMTAEVTYR